MEATNVVISDVSSMSLLTENKYERTLAAIGRSSDRRFRFKIVNWLKSNNDLVREGEQIAIISITYAFANIEALLRAKSSGVLKILVTTVEPIEIGTIVARIEKVSELDKYLISQQDQLISQLPLNQHTNTIDVFYSYEYEDEGLRKELEKHLSSLRSQHIIADWHDRNIAAGAEWQLTVSSHLDTAHLILLLVSPDFMASEYRYSIEMQRAMQRHASGDAQVVPILLRPVDWKGTPLAALPMLPSTGKPITVWSNRDDAFVNVVAGMRNIIQTLLEARLKPIQEQLQRINLQMGDLKVGYYNLKTSLQTLPEEQKILTEQRENIEKEINVLQMKMQEIIQKLGDIPQRQYSYENDLKGIQEKALEVRREEILFEQEAHSLKAQIDKVK